MDERLLDIKDMTKCYGKKEILRNINLSIHKGDSIALTGHNGSGKTTLLKIMAGLVNPTLGTINNPLHCLINYIPERFPPLNLTPRQYIRHMGLIEGLEGKEISRKSQELFESFFMEGMDNIPMKHLSKGTLQKVAVIQALLRTPSILLLDEPLSGQDIDSQNLFISLINRLRHQGTAIVLSCHEKFLVHRISSEVYEIANGNLTKILIDESSFIEDDTRMEIYHENHK